MKNGNLQRPCPFQKAFLKGPADTHDFAGRLHLCGKRIVGICELVKREPWKFGHHIVQRRFKRSRRVGDPYLIQRHSDTDLC